jgi:hypothetical protein
MRYLTLGIHYPKPECLDELRVAVERIATTARSIKGLVEAGAWLDETNNRVVLMSLWESEAVAKEATAILRPLISVSPWSRWERQPSENYLGLKAMV